MPSPGASFRIASVALAALPSCREQSSKMASDADPLRVAVPGGDPKFGRMTIFMQHHLAGGAPTDAEIQAIGRYQAAMLTELISHSPSYVFQEGQSQVLEGLALVDRIRETNIREHFRARPGGELSGEQLRCLATNGAALVYAALRPGVSILPTASPEFEARIHGEIDRERDPVERQRLTMDVREEACVESVVSIMRRLGAEKFALIYGRDHNTLPDKIVRSGHAPAIQVLDWPTLEVRIAADRAIADERDPIRQQLLVRELPYVPNYVFAALLSDEARREAIGKMDVRFEHFEEGARGLEEMLVLFANSDALKREIRQMAASGTGPFDAFKPFSVTSRISDADAASRPQLIRVSPYVQSWLFPFLSEGEQRLAVHKLVANDHQVGGELRVPYEELLSAAKSDAVRDALVARRDAGKRR